METIIDPMNLTDKHKTLLNLLLTQGSENEIGVFERGRPYEIRLPTPKGLPAETEKVTLTHTIYKRPREKHPKHIRYDIINETVSGAIADGAHSTIYKVVGTFKPSHKGLTLDTDNSRRLAKVEEFIAKYDLTDEFIQKTYNRTFNEMQLANLAGSGHMKQPAILINRDENTIKSYTTMRERKGTHLFDVLLEARKKRTEKYTTLQRLEITLSLLLAVKAVHDKGVIHRDIKPENMFYRFDKNQAKCIDFGFGKFKGEEDRFGHGTETYIPPELYDDEQSDEKSDLYALGILISLLWGNKEQDKDDEGNALPFDPGYHDPDFDTLFKYTKTDLSDSEKTMLKSWLHNITATDRKHRFSVDDAIDHLTDFITLYKKSRANMEKPEKNTETTKHKFHLFKKRSPVNDSPLVRTTPHLSGSGSKSY